MERYLREIFQWFRNIRLIQFLYSYKKYNISDSNDHSDINSSSSVEMSIENTHSDNKGSNKLGKSQIHTQGVIKARRLQISYK